MQNRGVRFVILGLIVAAVPLLADTSAGMEAFKKGDYATAFVTWKAAAEKGDAEAQFDLGVLYAKGLGTDQNMQQAVRLYRSAAEHGNVQAAFSLGQLYSKGWGVPRDDAEALRWFQAANSPDPDNPVRLGWIVAEGYGVPQDYAVAAFWYRNAAQKGHAEAQFNLAHLYATGKGVQHDDEEAARWCRAAATQGYAPAQARLGWRFANGNGVPHDDGQAYFWLTLASRNGNKHYEKLRSSLAVKLTPTETARLDESARAWQEKRTITAKK